MRVICPFKNRCVSYPFGCRRCRHNLGERDFFEPDTPWKDVKRERWIIGARAR